MANEPTPPPVSAVEHKTLICFGYTSAQIDAMSPAQRQAEYEDALESGMIPPAEAKPEDAAAVAAIPFFNVANGPRAVEPRWERQGELQRCYDKIFALERKNQNHQELWFMVIATAIVFAGVYLTTPRRVPSEPWDGANRCQTLWIIEEAASANLAENAAYPSDAALLASIKESLNQCAPESGSSR